MYFSLKLPGFHRAIELGLLTENPGSAEQYADSDQDHAYYR
jgi:hypothetical protein